MAALEAVKWELFTPVMIGLEPLRRRTLRRALAATNELCPLAGREVLDVGAGVGTLLAELARYDCRVTAIEPSFVMARVARARAPAVTVHEVPADAMADLPAASIDVAILAATLHGFSPAYRAQVYAELRRVVREAVVIIDYHSNRNPFVALAEWLEGGDYFAFVKTIDAELDANFARVERRRIGAVETLRVAWFSPADGAGSSSPPASPATE